MTDQNKVLAVAEPSYMIRKGLVYILSQQPYVKKVVELRENENIAYQLDILQPDALLINPMLLGQLNKGDIRQQLGLNKQTAVIALVYNLIDDRFYQSYDAIIKINDSETKITEILNGSINQKSNIVPEQDDLSDREREILIGIVKGMSNKEIADFYNISIHTVITHRRNISRKLDIHSVSGLTIYAILNKLIDIKEIEL